MRDALEEAGVTARIATVIATDTAQAIIDIHPDIFVVHVKESHKPREPKRAFLRAFLELPEGLTVSTSISSTLNPSGISQGLS